MNVFHARAALFAAGAALWIVFSIFPFDGQPGLREGWDRAQYWSIGVPLLLLSQTAIAYFWRARFWSQPLWVLFGHLVAMLVVHPSGNDFGLFPLALVFIGIPGYGALLAAVLLGRALAALRR